MKQLYRSYDESTNLFNNFEKVYPSLIKVESIGQTWEKRDINLITLSSDIETASSRPALFFTGTIHAREWIGHELAIDFVKYVVENIEIDPVLQNILSRATIYMVPCANPDGFEYSRTHFSFWRKNRRQNADGSFGVDLNRNFPIGFVKSTSTTSNIYGGPEPFSEPETCALRDFVESHPNICIALDYHSQGNVFFPAHDFRHEDTIDTTDMNILCANMAEEIRKVSGREYGIHQGKPPAKLISGSGREFYYSKGAISTVVEVGTRNISDYIEHMTENIKEHIPALIAAAQEVPNYDKNNELKRVENFNIEEVGSKHVLLKWDYDADKNVHFEIYRSLKNKSYCTAHNLITRTQALNFRDDNLQSGKDYYYNIRAVRKGIISQKSKYTPQVRVRTNVEYNEFSRLYYANSTQTGYVASNINNNAKHFGVNSLFVGIDENKGVSYAVVTIELKSIPLNAIIKKAGFHLYPINRVSTTIEKYGEWNVGIVNQETMGDITNFEDVDNMEILRYVGSPTASHQLTQGIWRDWSLSRSECSVLTNEIKNEKVVLRIEGPTKLRTGRKSQMMQWDIGYERFGFGLSYRPFLDLTYTLEPTISNLYPKSITTISKEEIKQDIISSGFDSEGHKIYTSFEFDLSSLPPHDFTMITKAYFELNSKNIYTKDDIRFHLEFVDEDIINSYKGISDREIIQNIGYDLSANELKNNQKQYFMFDSFAEIELNKKLQLKANVAFVLKPTSSKKVIKDSIVNWSVEDNDLSPKLIIEHIPKRRLPVDMVKNFKLFKENGKIKLSWDNPDNKDFAGVKIIKNPFREPYSYNDGQKLYAGKDNYTYDSFGALDVEKYYAVFTFDDIPNYSKPVIIKYTP